MAALSLFLSLTLCGHSGPFLMATGSHYAACVLSLKILRINKKEIRRMDTSGMGYGGRGAFIVNSKGIIIWLGV